MGLAPTFFWALSTPEFEALKRVHERKKQQWAFERAEFRNGHFSTEGVPWEPSDFLGESSRDVRLEEQRLDDIAAQKEMLSAALPGAIIPEWALKAHELHLQRLKGQHNG